MAEQLAKSGDPDQMPHYVASDLGLHFLPIPLQEFPVKNGCSAVQCWSPDNDRDTTNYLRATKHRYITEPRKGHFLSDIYQKRN